MTTQTWVWAFDVAAGTRRRVYHRTHNSLVGAMDHAVELWRLCKAIALDASFAVGVVTGADNEVLLVSDSDEPNPTDIKHVTWVNAPWMSPDARASDWEDNDD